MIVIALVVVVVVAAATALIVTKGLVLQKSRKVAFMDVNQKDSVTFLCETQNLLLKYINIWLISLKKLSRTKWRSQEEDQLLK